MPLYQKWSWGRLVRVIAAHSSQAYFLSTRSSEKVRVPQDIRARICTGMRAASSEYQIQIFPLSRSTPEAAVSGCTQVVLKSRPGSCCSLFRARTVRSAAIVDREAYVLPGSRGRDAT